MKTDESEEAHQRRRRKLAEPQIKRSAPKAIPKQDVFQLMHEPKAHQVKLEMQNDELQRSQSELEDLRKKFLDLYNLAPVGYVTLDRNRIIREINHTGAELLGRERVRLTRTSESPEVDPFVAGVTRILLTFFSVCAIDVVVVSLVTGRLRFWFPLWLDPQWATRPDPWVVYSQSYFAGIFMIPVLCWLVDRDFLVGLGTGARVAFWSSCLVVFAIVLWWKGLLMLEYHKHYEVLGWATLTGLIWTIIRFADIHSERIIGLTRRRMLIGLLFGLSLFFLVMSVLDPLVQLGIQKLGWSWSLAIEVGFFVPAGVALMTLSHRLRV